MQMKNTCIIETCTACPGHWPSLLSFEQNFDEKKMFQLNWRPFCPIIQMTRNVWPSGVPFFPSQKKVGRKIFVKFQDGGSRDDRVQIGQISAETCRTTGRSFPETNAQFSESNGAVVGRVQIVQIERHQAAQFDVLRSAARRAAPVAHLQAHLQPALRVAASRRRRRPWLAARVRRRRNLRLRIRYLNPHVTWLSLQAAWLFK